MEELTQRGMFPLLQCFMHRFEFFILFLSHDTCKDMFCLFPLPSARQPTWTLWQEAHSTGKDERRYTFRAKHWPPSQLCVGKGQTDPIRNSSSASNGQLVHANKRSTH